MSLLFLFIVDFIEFPSIFLYSFFYKLFIPMNIDVEIFVQFKYTFKDFTLL